LAASSWAFAQEFTSNYSANITLRTLGGKAVATVDKGEVFRIAVEIDDAITQAPATALRLEGWIRPVEATNLPCGEAAQSFRATGRLPVGAHDLGGSLLVTVNDDASFGVVDPQRNLASANMIKAGTLPELPATTAAHWEQQAFYFALPNAGEIRRLALPNGDLQTFKGGLDRPGAMFSAGDAGAWIVERGRNLVSLLDQDGNVTFSSPVGRGEMQASSLDDGPIAFYAANGATIVVDRRTGAILARLNGAANATDFALIRGRTGQAVAVAFLVGDNRDIDLRYLDNPERSRVIHLPRVAQLLAASPDGRFLIALDTAGGVSIVDVAFGQTIQDGSLRRATREVAFSGGVAVFLHADTAAAEVLDLSTIRPGAMLQLRETSLGAPTLDIPPGARLLLPLSETSQIMAVNRDGQIGFIIDEHSMAIGAPPMSAVSLRGGLTRSVDLARRGFREVEPGRYATTAAVEAAGDYELVLTTGVRGLSTCYPIAVKGERAPARLQLAIRLRADAPTPSAGQPGRLEFELVDANGAALPVRRAAVVLQAMEFSMRRTVMAKRLDHRLVADVQFPSAGPYVVDVDIGAGSRVTIAPLLLTVTE